MLSTFALQQLLIPYMTLWFLTHSSSRFLLLLSPTALNPLIATAKRVPRTELSSKVKVTVVTVAVIVLRILEEHEVDQKHASQNQSLGLGARGHREGCTEVIRFRNLLLNH